MSYEASIIVPIFDHVEYTRQCLIALSHTIDGFDCEVVIVDNGSTDGTKNLLESLSGDVRVITNEGNLGFARACNQGTERARGEFLVFLNNDTIPTPGWLPELLKVFRKDPRVGVAGSKLIFPEERGAVQGERVQHCGIAFDENRESLHIYKFCLASQPFVNKKREFQAVTGAAMMIPRSLFEAIGRFDEEYENGGEDLDICFKIRKRGRSVVYCPESEIYHFESVTLRALQNRGHFPEHRNYQFFLEKWGGSIETDVYRFYREDTIRFPSERAPRIAVVSRFTPEREAVGGDTQDLLPFLSKYAAIDVFVGSGTPTDSEVLNHYRVHRIRDLRYVDWMYHYDQIIYFLENDRFNPVIEEAAMEMQGVLAFNECKDSISFKEFPKKLFEEAKGVIVHEDRSKRIIEKAFPYTPVKVVPFRRDAPDEVARLYVDVCMNLRIKHSS